MTSSSDDARDKAAEEYIGEHFAYHADGHIVRTKRDPGQNGGRLGKALRGYRHYSGYRYMRIQGRHWALHRIVFLLNHGYLPAQVDHINRDKSDNKIENLRASTPTENSFNAFRPNKTGIKGLLIDTRTKKYYGSVAKNYKHHYTKRFTEKELAHKALIKLQKELYGDLYKP